MEKLLCPSYDSIRQPISQEINTENPGMGVELHLINNTSFAGRILDPVC